MGDMGDLWREHREHKQEKKRSNITSSIHLIEKLADESKLELKKLSNEHYRIGLYDFWPSTGRYMHVTTKKKGRGVFNLIKLLKEQKDA